MIAPLVLLLLASGPTEDNYREARALVHEALALHGGGAAEPAAWMLSARGTQNRAAEYQGRRLPEEGPDDGAFSEVLAFDSATGELAHEARHERSDGTFEWTREIRRPGGERLIVGPGEGFAVRLAPETPPEVTPTRRLLRRLPRFLLTEVLEQPEHLRSLGRSGAHELVSGRLESGETVTLCLSAESGLLEGVELLTDAPAFGDVTVRWRFDDHRAVGGLGLVPWRYGVDIDGRPFLRMTVETASTAREDVLRWLRPPGGVEVPEEPIVEPDRADAEARVVELAPGVHLVVHLRTGFHPLFVELEDSVVAVDAPAGYPLLGELPPADVAPGPASDWLSRRFLELIEETVPEKPLRHLVLTHFHNDHAGGLRAFVARGATVVAASAARPAIERLVHAPHTLAPDLLAREPRPLALETVDDRLVLGAGERRVEILAVGENPHAEDMLVVHLPGSGIVYASDLFTGAPLERFPTPSHEALDRFFVRWLDERGLAPTRIYSSHGGRGTPEHLDELRE